MDPADEGGYRSLSALPGWAPVSDRPASEERTVEIDGETFALRPDGSGGTHYDWVSGPNPDYGFTVSPTFEGTLEEHQACIRSFLSQVDPVTGFIEAD